MLFLRKKLRKRFRFYGEEPGRAGGGPAEGAHGKGAPVFRGDCQQDQRRAHILLPD